MLDIKLLLKKKNKGYLKSYDTSRYPSGGEVVKDFKKGVKSVTKPLHFNISNNHSV